jgi:hypothetical protein
MGRLLDIDELMALLEQIKEESGNDTSSGGGDMVMSSPIQGVFGSLTHTPFPTYDSYS